MVAEIPQAIERIDEKTNLLEEGILTSLEMALLIPALEEEFSIEEIDVEDIIPENFISIEAISKLVKRYLAHEC
ncbi:MAG: acyl carrier protein [Lachnospiraceae bacterium]|nr:acyl carrier protein [Lachnospiraceae bacterium]